MATRFLLDTNICIYIRQRKPPTVLERFQKLSVNEAALSVITFGELLYGAVKSVQRERALEQLSDLTGLLAVLPLPDSAAREYGDIRASLEGKGSIIGNNDLWIAAHARAEGLTLVTNNEREFRRVPGLKVQNWAA